MSNFKDYAKYYNLLYKDKDYRKEVEYIKSLLEKHSQIPIQDILDIGCGTGRHDILLSENDHRVTGIDMSEGMIAIAKESNNKRCKFEVADARDFNLERKFDASVSLFHVASYQTSNEDFKNYLRSIHGHLKKDGLFIFDFWYGPAVLTDLPEVRIKRLEDDDVKIHRLTEPVLYPNENIVDVNFEILIEDKKSKIGDTIREKHKMRYFFLPELESFMEQTGFAVVDSYKWMSESKLDFDSWYGVMITKKIEFDV